MTGLSVFRISTVGTMIQSRMSSTKCKVKTILAVITVILASGTIALVPLIKQLENFFVNGLYYHQNPLFTSSVSKETHYQIFLGQYGRSKIKEASMSWDRVRHLTKEMFTADYGGKQKIIVSKCCHPPALPRRSLPAT